MMLLHFRRTLCLIDINALLEHGQLLGLSDLLWRSFICVKYAFDIRDWESKVTLAEDLLLK